MIIYVHGFASVGNSAKAAAIRAAFPSERVESPTLPFDPAGTMKILNDLVTDGFNKGEKRFVVIGTSLGAFYALNLAATRDVIAVVVNPALNAQRDMKEKFFGINLNFATGEQFEVTQEAIDQLVALKAETNAKLNMANVYAIVALDDELLDVPEMTAFGRSAKDYVESSTGGHRFDAKWQYALLSTALALNEIYVK